MSQEYAPSRTINVNCAEYMCSNREWSLVSDKTQSCEGDIYIVL